MDENKTNQNIQGLFKKVREMNVSQPYLSTRVLANLSEQRKSQKSLLIWKSLFTLSFTFSVVLLFAFLKLYTNSSSDGSTHRAYVLHFNFDQNDQKLITKAQVELPEDVYFVSQDNQLLKERKLTLPLTIKEVGRGKLPFVLSAKSAGSKKIIVQLLDENDHVIKNQILNFKFAQNQSQFNNRKE